MDVYFGINVISPDYSYLFITLSDKVCNGVFGTHIHVPRYFMLSFFLDKNWLKQLISALFQSYSWRLFIYVLCPYKRQISMQRFIALRGVRAHKNVESFTTLGKRYIYGSKPCSRAFNTIGNKQQIMQNNVETQHKHSWIVLSFKHKVRRS